MRLLDRLAHGDQTFVIPESERARRRAERIAAAHLRRSGKAAVWRCTHCGQVPRRLPAGTGKTNRMPLCHCGGIVAPACAKAGIVLKTSRLLIPATSQ